MKQIEIANVLHHTELAPGIFDLRLAAPGICGAARPGQFVEVYLDDGAHMLPRPISICELENGVLRLVYQAVGAGTKALSKKQAGESLRLLGPLGNGFAPAGEKHILVAGGIGAPPLLGLHRPHCHRRWVGRLLRQCGGAGPAGFGPGGVHGVCLRAPAHAPGAGGPAARCPDFHGGTDGLRLWRVRGLCDSCPGRERGGCYLPEGVQGRPGICGKGGRVGCVIPV